MKKMGKKVLGTIAMGAATVATGMAANVHADNITVTKQQVGDETKITTTTTKDVNQQKVSQDEQAISNQQKIVDNAKSTLDSAKANSNSSSQAVSSAQSNVDNTKKALNNAKDQVSKVSSSKIKQQIQQDQNQVAQDKQSINTTQSSIQQDQTNINNDQQSIANVDQKVQQDHQKLNIDQNKLENAQSELSNDQSNVTKIKSQLQSLNSENPSVSVNGQDAEAYLKALSETPQIYMAKGKTTNVEQFLFNQPAIKAYSNQHNISGIDGGSKLSDLTKNVSVNIPDGGYASDKDNYTVSPENLTRDQSTELTKFVDELINDFREKVGVAPLKLTDAVVSGGEQDAENYNHDNWKVSERKHDQKAFGNAGFTAEDADDNYENVLGHSMTMNELKTIVAKSVEGLMHSYDGHAQGLIAPYVEAVGFGINKYGDLLYPTLQKELFLGYNDKGNPTFFGGNQSLLNGSDLLMNDQSVQSEINKLNNSLTDAENKVVDDKQNIQKLQNVINADKVKLQKDTPDSLRKQLSKDQQKLVNDQNTLKQQQDKLAKDEAQLKNDQDRLNSITPAEVAKAQQQLGEAQSNYNDAVKKLNEAQNKANASKDEVAKAQQNYLDALNKLNELKQVLEDDKKEITTTSVEWIKNEHPVTTANMGNKVVLSSSKGSTQNSSESTVKATISNKTTLTSESSAYVATTVKPAKNSLVKETQSTNSIHFTSEAPVQFSTKNPKGNTNKAVLPQMGDENSKSTLWGEISLAVAGILASFGLAGRKRFK